MYHLNKFIGEFKTMGGELAVEEFSVVENALSRIEEALNEPDVFQTPLPSAKWDTGTLTSIIEDLTPSGFISYSGARKKYGKGVILSLILHNVLIYRPGRKFAFDLPDLPGAPIVMAPSPVEMYAMKVLSKK